MSTEQTQQDPLPKGHNGLLKGFVDSIAVAAFINGLSGLIPQTRYQAIFSILLSAFLFIVSLNFDKIDVRFPKFGESARSIASNAWAWLFIITFLLILVGNSILYSIFNCKIVGYILSGIPIQMSSYFSENDLGPTAGPIEKVKHLVVMRYDKAWVIWADYKFFVIYNHSPSHQADVFQDVQPESQSSWFSDEKMRIQTKTPDDKCPPTGGFAHIWKPDMGYRRTYRAYKGSANVFYEKYQNGWKIGPLPTSDGSSDSRAISINTSNFLFDQMLLSNISAPVGEKIINCGVDGMD